MLYRYIRWHSRSSSLCFISQSLRTLFSVTLTFGSYKQRKEFQHKLNEQKKQQQQKLAKKKNKKEVERVKEKQKQTKSKEKEVVSDESDDSEDSEDSDDSDDSEDSEDSEDSDSNGDDKLVTTRGKAHSPPNKKRKV